MTERELLELRPNMKLCVGAPVCLTCSAPHREGVIQRCPAKRLRMLEVSVVFDDGWGDQLKAFMDEHGITEEWWAKFKQKLGAKGVCVCPWRQAFLNEFGREFGKSKLGAFKKVFKWIIK